VTKENSRQTRMLRRFAVPAHNIHNALVVFIHLFKVFFLKEYFTLFHIHALNASAESVRN
jgi:hypothetical protein